LIAARTSLKAGSKDDNDIIVVNDLGAKKEFAQNNYWRQPEQYDLDDLL
jgi:hypothetical protein